MQKLIIEKLSKKDLSEAISIYDDNHNIKTNYERLYNEYEKIYNNPDYHNIIARLDKKIVGIATVIINHDIVAELKPFITVWNFSVHKDYRRQKIGTQMLEYIDKFAQDNNCDFVSLIAEKENRNAQKFYESNGYSKEVGYVKFFNKDNK